MSRMCHERDYNGGGGGTVAAPLRALCPLRYLAQPVCRCSVEGQPGAHITICAPVLALTQHGPRCSTGGGGLAAKRNLTLTLIFILHFQLSASQRQREERWCRSVACNEG